MPRKDYSQKLEADNAANLARSRVGRDIADGYPGPGNKRRRESCRRDLGKFYTTYFRSAFPLASSEDQVRVDKTTQSVVIDGGLSALAMPRGSGKTTRAERAALFGLLYGYRRFVALIGPTELHAEQLLAKIKFELLYNDLLFEDFPEVCYPIRRLENNARKAVGQLFGGKPTNINWGRKRLVLPTMPADLFPGPNLSGFVIIVAGLTGSVRGLSSLLPDGTIIRPDLVILDDPQTRESANSSTQTAERAAIISGDVLGMAGPGRKIAALMPCTVIRSGDLADQCLDRQLNPQWQGERTKAVYAWPTNEKLWEEYHRIRADGQRKGDGGRAATEFYRSHREAMDAGSRVAWPARFNPDELSAIQHCQNLRADLGEAAFAAEYQNEPIDTAAGEIQLLTAAQIAAKLSGLKRGIAPLKAAHMTAFIDVHDTLLYWAVCGWAPDFSGAIIDYGVYPKQPRRVFAMRKATRTLSTVLPGAGQEAAIAAGLKAVTAELLGREYQRLDGVALRIERCLIDAGYKPDVVYEFCATSPHAGLLMPSRGLGITATKAPISEWPPKTGEKRGLAWVIGRVPSRHLRHVKFDAHFWKSFVHARLAVKHQDPGSLSLYGQAESEHLLIADHLTAEMPTRVSANGRTVDEWSLRPGRADNHWLDCVVGCTVAASQLGVILIDVTATPPPKPKKMSLGEMYARARAKGRAA